MYVQVALLREMHPSALNAMEISSMDEFQCREIEAIELGCFPTGKGMIQLTHGMPVQPFKAVTLLQPLF